MSFLTFKKIILCGFIGASISSMLPIFLAFLTDVGETIRLTPTVPGGTDPLMGVTPLFALIGIIFGLVFGLLYHHVK